MITLECNYSKKIGLPQYSSHQFSVTLKTEIADVSQAEGESARLYRLLQTSVDDSIREVGFLPGSNGNSHGNGNGNGNGHNNGNQPVSEKDTWKCSPAQKNLILKVVEEHKLDKLKVEELAVDRFGAGVKSLTKLQASGLIEELLQMTGQGNSRGRFKAQPKAGQR
jgi:hypothetical protein